MTHDDTLIRMANQIGTYFESMSDRAEALEGIANHIQKFWDPRMRKAFLAYVDGPNQRDIKLIVLTAMAEHRALIDPLAK